MGSLPYEGNALKSICQAEGVGFVPSIAGTGAFCPLTGADFVLSVPDGVLLGVLPPAGNFSRQRKVTKSPLRTNGSKDSFVSLYWLS